MKRTLVLLTALLAVTAWAQEQKAPPAETQVSGSNVVKVFTVKPANLERIGRTVRMVVGDGNVTWDNATATLVVRTTAVLMPAVEQVAKQLDIAVPRAPNIELTFYILQATKEPQPDATALPAGLRPAIAQLKSIFFYQGFRLLDTALIRARSGENAEASGQAQLEDSTTGYHLNLRPSVSSETHPATIRIDNLHYQEWVKATNVGFGANVDLKEGQYVVVGKTSMEGTRSAFILVASARVVE